MATEESARTHTTFVINDQVNGYPARSVTTEATGEELSQLVQRGYLVRRGVLPAHVVTELADSVHLLAKSEEGKRGAEWVENESIYLRRLFDKDAAFHQLLRLEPALSISRILLGPQVWIDLEARMHYPGSPDVAVPWHNHLPVIPEPLPAFFSYPHQIHCLIYLDRVSEPEGALCLLPGSHTRTGLRIPLGDQSDYNDQVELFFEAGDAVLIHGNLWHKTKPSTTAAGHRRLLLLGYVPSWIRGDIGQHGVAADKPLTAELARNASWELKELLGEFNW
ncbi:phytanoyl-CoA dioxygenase family protein [Amycolatopsis eburnea]|uniref:Phytanoyl-CoA dioxygenase family protein n=1 Tax=Amycolatopsis eburnea TaxID=2267691 RepID=A0A3R9KRI9_9PSEU|nr:phytanoyl-CoA dioxygenase family protein [Amycolatopsis eburnea]RSD23915.1 hypothetical protein EIY87_05975 [Amycolatopsis eburnea]